MAILKQLSGSSFICLKPVHILGRDPNVADTLLTTQSCSRLHCVFRWQSGQWFVTDESRNGCFLNAKKMDSGQSVRIKKGDRFSTSPDASDHWVMADESVPKPVIVNNTATKMIELSPLNILPNDREPECQILQQGPSWYYENDQDRLEMSEGFSLALAGDRWTFFPNAVLQETEIFSSTLGMDIPELVFHVSQDEEHVELTLNVGKQSFALGHKNHHYLLLEVARHALETTNDDEEEWAWMSIDLLLRNLRIEINYMNIMIYRARAAIRKCSSYWGENLIERRRGELRFHRSKIKVVKI